MATKGTSLQLGPLPTFALLCASPWLLIVLIGLVTKKKTPIDTVQGLPSYQGPRSIG